jgi:hypothetical protein
VDGDLGDNGVLNYWLEGSVGMTLSEGMESITQPPFLVDPITGAVYLNFDPQKGMKGYFDFNVSIFSIFIYRILA